MTLKQHLKFSVTVNKIKEIMKNKQAAIITYRNPEEGTIYTRYIDIYVLGTLKSGAKAIRAYQETGGSYSHKNVLEWKIFRLDRIIDCVPYNYMREVAPSDYKYPGDSAFSHIDLQLPALNYRPSEPSSTVDPVLIMPPFKKKKKKKGEENEEEKK